MFGKGENMSNIEDDKDIIIEEAPKTDAEPDIKIEKAEKDRKNVVFPEDGIKDLKFQLEQERLARIEAERRANEAAQRVAVAKNEVDTTNLQLVSNAIKSVKGSNEALKAKYKEAMSIGDYDRATEIQAAMSDNSAKLRQLKDGKKVMKQQIKTMTTPQVQPSVSHDPVEALASQLSPRSAAWVRRNPQYATDTRLFNKMIAAHNLAIADGIEPDSDDYFMSVEDTLKVRNQPSSVDVDNPYSSAATPTQRRTAPPAAPVSRNGNGTGSRPNVVRLTGEQREMAAAMGMTEKEYALNMLALQKEGKLN
jgi:hypothetical protein